MKLISWQHLWSLAETWQPVMLWTAVRWKRPPAAADRVLPPVKQERERKASGSALQAVYRFTEAISSTTVGHSDDTENPTQSSRPNSVTNMRVTKPKDAGATGSQTGEPAELPLMKYAVDSWV